MVRYSIFTEFDCSEESRKKNKADLDALEEKLMQSNIHIIQRSQNSIVVEYGGNPKEFRAEVDNAISQIMRQSQMPIYKAPEEMYSYKK